MFLFSNRSRVICLIICHIRTDRSFLPIKAGSLAGYKVNNGSLRQRVICRRVHYYVCTFIGLQVLVEKGGSITEMDMRNICIRRQSTSYI